MKKLNKNKIKGIVVSVITCLSVVGGAVILDNDSKDIDPALLVLIEKQESGSLNYHEYLELANAYNAEIERLGIIEFENIYNRNLIIPKINSEIKK